MAIVRVQLTQEINGAPAVGKWQVYRGAYFDVAGSPIPDGTVRPLLSRLFNGHDPTGTPNNSVLSYQAYRTGAASLRIKTWTLAGGEWTNASDWTGTLEPIAPTSTPYRRLPLQCSVAVGYRADLGPGVPRQRGRSRWFLGPLIVGGGILDATDTQGGPRLTTAAVDRLASNAAGCVAALAAHGWVLGVRVLEGSTAVPATEVYVDDVLDVQRRRRTWQTHQARESL